MLTNNSYTTRALYLKGAHHNHYIITHNMLQCVCVVCVLCVCCVCVVCVLCVCCVCVVCVCVRVCVCMCVVLRTMHILHRNS